MPTLLQINITANWGSTGRIAEGIGQKAIENGWRSIIAYGRNVNKSHSELIRIGNNKDIYAHLFGTRLLDRHGLMSRHATRDFVEKLERIKPDIIHLHNIHGYYVNYPVLFNYIKEKNLPVVWTLHDCWSFTGHCCHFVDVGCERWKTQCHNCPAKKHYPASWVKDRSISNFLLKKNIYGIYERLQIVTVSSWLQQLVQQSFLGSHSIHTIHNGIDIETFRPQPYPGKSKKTILGLSSVWNEGKGLYDFYKLRELLPRELYDIVIVGLKPEQANDLPVGVQGIVRTESVQQLTELYSMANVFVNPTYADSFPTVNLEALACGTPVITYRTGGSPEAVDENTGIVVEQGDINGLAEAIKTICKNGKEQYNEVCRKRAVDYFNKSDRFADYVNLYEELLQK